MIIAATFGQAESVAISEQTRSLFTPNLQLSISRIPLPLSLEALDQRLLVLEKKIEEAEKGSQRDFQRVLFLNERAALEALHQSVCQWKDTPDEKLQTLWENLQAGENDLDHIRGSGKWIKTLSNLVGYVDLSGDEDLKRKLLAYLNSVLQTFPKDPSSLVSSSGNSWEGRDFSGPDDPRRKNYDAREAALLFAFRYHLEGEAADAEKVKAILLRFGQVMPEWELYTRGGQAFSEKRNGPEWFLEFRQQRGDNGLFGIWYYLELTAALPLAKAYALTSKAYRPLERAQIQTSVLDYIVENLGRYSFTGGDNLAVFHLQGLLAWGRLLGNPDFIHEALRLYDKLVLEGFYPDGYWLEFTTDYHRQVFGPLAYTIPGLMAGYSDPAGYSNPQTGLRYDNLQLLEKYRLPLQASLSAMADVVLPDGTYAAISDTEAGRAYNFTPSRNISQPRLLGASGVAVLGSGTGAFQSELYLLYKGTLGGHVQEDALSILWYAHGMEVLSETTYRGPKESYKFRPWYRSAAAHNTVVVDERPQYFQRSRFVVPSEDLLWEGAGATTNQGELLLFDTTLPEAQFVEAEFVRAYHPVVSRFQRTLAYVPLEKGDGYLVDIFRVRGGGKHDYIIRGGLDQPYTVAVSLPAEKFAAKVFDHIQIDTRYAVTKPAQLEFHHVNGVNLTARILSPHSATTTLLGGEGPAIRRAGTAPMFLLRNQTAEGVDGPLDSTFVVVYDVSRSGSSLKSARFQSIPGSPETVVVEVEWKNHRDILISSANPEAGVAFDGLQFSGQLGFLRYAGGEPVLAHLSSEGKLSVAGKLDLEARPTDTGTVVRGSADPLKNDPIVLDQAPELSPGDKILHLDFGDTQRFSYPIIYQSGCMLQTAYPAGFQLEGNGFQMNRAPGWKGEGPVRWSIPHSATWRRPTSARREAVRMQARQSSAVRQ